MKTKYILVTVAPGSLTEWYPVFNVYGEFVCSVPRSEAPHLTYEQACGYSDILADILKEYSGRANDTIIIKLYGNGNVISRRTVLKN